MTLAADPAAKAAERIASACWPMRFTVTDETRRAMVGDFAAIIRAEYAEVPIDRSTDVEFAAAKASYKIVKARAEHLESVLAKVREECELWDWHRGSDHLRKHILAILNESGEAAGGSE